MPIQHKKGRTIRTGRAYSEFRRELFDDQGGLCLRCSRRIVFEADIDADFSAHLSHRGSRGMGGAIRDDVVGPNRGQVEGIICGQCHRKEHHQQ